MGQYRKYIALMEKNGSDRITDAMFFNKKIIQIFGNQMSLEELGEADAVEFLTAAKGIHFIMQSVITQKLLDVVEVEQVEKEASAFDEYDIENGYEEENEPEQDMWKTCREIIDRIVKIAIRLLKNSYSQCMGEDIVALLDYLKYELDTIEENGDWREEAGEWHMQA